MNVFVVKYREQSYYFHVFNCAVIVCKEKRFTGVTFAHLIDPLRVTSLLTSSLPGRHLGGQAEFFTYTRRSRKMVNFYAIVGSGNCFDRDKGVSFYRRLPAEITHEGERTQELSKKKGI